MAEETKQDIFSFITTETTNYQSMPITVLEGWDWNMFKHIKLSNLYKNSRFSTGNSDDKPFKNIIRPILNLQYRAEGFDVKDIVLFVNDKVNYWKSFIIKKFHEFWVLKNGIDTFIDDDVESYVDIGGSLEKIVNGKPQVVPMQRIAFCDQTDILSGPICERHYFSPDQLKETEKQGWGDKNKGADITIDELIVLSKCYKISDQSKQQSKTPGKNIEIFELHGMFPNWWLKEGESDKEDDKFTRQLHIIAFYQKEDNKTKQGVHLYKGKEKESIYKFIARDKIYGRALGFGGAEELFEPQVWTNYSAIRVKDMLDAASKIIYQTADESFAQRNKIKDLENQEILIYSEGKPLTQINTTPVNIKLFENSIVEWDSHARTMAAAQESIMGEQPNSGTPFALQELVTAEAHSLHEYRKGKIATHIEEIYRDWIIPQIVKELNEGQEFLSELDSDELQGIADAIVINEANKVIKEKILNGELVEKEEIEKLKQETRDNFMKGGNKKFIEILKDELKDAPIDVKVNVSGKQKYLAQMTDKLSKVFSQMLSTYDPQTKTFAIFEDPRMLKIFSQIVEYSELSPIDFYQSSKTKELLSQPI